MQPGIYRHYKGNYYRFLFVARHSETLEEYGAYQALYGDCSYWLRPLAMFNELVEVAGIQQPRFAYVGQVVPECSQIKLPTETSKG